MPTFGFWELALVMLVALLVVGPDRLPELAAQAGRWIGRVKRLASSFKNDLSQELDAEELKRTIAAPHDEIKKLGAEVEREVRNLDPLVKAMDEQIESGRFAGDNDDNGQGNDQGNDQGNGKGR